MFISLTLSFFAQKMLKRMFLPAFGPKQWSKYTTFYVFFIFVELLEDLLRVSEGICFFTRTPNFELGGWLRIFKYLNIRTKNIFEKSVSKIFFFCCDIKAIPRWTRFGLELKVPFWGYYFYLVCVPFSVIIVKQIMKRGQVICQILVLTNLLFNEETNHVDLINHCLLTN